MEEIAAYQSWIDRIKRLIANAESRREERRYRNLKNKANGGFNVLQHGDVQSRQVSS